MVVYAIVWDSPRVFNMRSTCCEVYAPNLDICAGVRVAPNTTGMCKQMFVCAPYVRAPQLVCAATRSTYVPLVLLSLWGALVCARACASVCAVCARHSISYVRNMKTDDLCTSLYEIADRMCGGASISMCHPRGTQGTYGTYPWHIRLAHTTGTYHWHIPRHIPWHIRHKIVWHIRQHGATETSLGYQVTSIR